MKVQMRSGMIMLLLLGVFLPAPAQQEDKQVVEQMEIINVRVPVRVYLEGKPARGLTIDDFTLYENGREKRLTGFDVVSRKIKVTTDAPAESLPSRLFVLVFKITDINPKVDEALDYLFKDIFHRGDEILVFFNDVTRQFVYQDNRQAIYDEIYGTIKKESTRARQVALQYIQKIDLLIMKFKRLLQASEYQSGGGRVSVNQNEMISFLREYLQIWDEYKRRYLTHNWELYANFAKFLEKEEREKWVLDFFQIESFPRIKENSYIQRVLTQRIADYEASGDPKFQAFARILRKLLQDIDEEMNVPNTYFLEKVTPLYYNLEVTFHSFFIPSTQKRYYRDIAYQNITSQIESALRELTRVTGGEVLVSGKLKESIQKVEELEDIMYVLFFSPDDPKNIGKIKIKTADSRYTLAYDRKRNKDYISEYITELSQQMPSLKIDGRFQGRTLTVNLSGVALNQNTQTGRVGILIQAFDDQTRKEVFKAGKAFDTKKGLDQFSVSLGFNQLEAGSYTFVISAQDLNTQEKERIQVKATFQ